MGGKLVRREPEEMLKGSVPDVPVAGGGLALTRPADMARIEAGIAVMCIHFWPEEAAAHGQKVG